MIVADTNVILRGIRSRSSASGFVLRGMLDASIAFALTPAMVLEYEDVLKRPGIVPGVSSEDLDVILDALCFRARRTTPFFRFRPVLDDPKDDLVIECAVTAGAYAIVTHDRHFSHPSVAAFGLIALTAQDFVIRHRSERSSP
ncbi:putative nucleic acid-binding protein [Rhizobium sp. PP-WC-2G-219]|nr:putative nucleic acid-binding protein [Rhizobium sp. PP-CC-3A-592]TCL96595.1 putative nucleic acid-binding protein [Rhizobium sp. PP-WC-2G-219]